jgi:hypothetical protein
MGNLQMVYSMSTPAYKKAQRQAAHAEDKRRREYENLIKCSKSAKKEFKEYAPAKPYVRDTKEYPSLTTSDTIPGSCAKKERREYTGNYIIGIATMHKSNLVPVGRGEDPTDYATMRRN